VPPLIGLGNHDRTHHRWGKCHSTLLCVRPSWSPAKGSPRRRYRLSGAAGTDAVDPLAASSRRSALSAHATGTPDYRERPACQSSPHSPTALRLEDRSRARKPSRVYDRSGVRTYSRGQSPTEAFRDQESPDDFTTGGRPWAMQGTEESSMARQSPESWRCCVRDSPTPEVIMDSSVDRPTQVHRRWCSGRVLRAGALPIQGDGGRSVLMARQGVGRRPGDPHPRGPSPSAARFLTAAQGMPATAVESLETIVFREALQILRRGNRPPGTASPLRPCAAPHEDENDRIGR
jgi:hypothetical protein